MKTFKQFREGVEDEIQEAPMDGVEKGSLDGDKHMCATKIFHKEWQEGTPVIGEHGEPDEDGVIHWYKVMFEHGIETVAIANDNVEVLMSEAHMNHKKKGY